MNDILQKILVDKRQYVDQQKKLTPWVEIDHKARLMTAPRPFRLALQAKIMSDDIGLITEIKKASPSAGLIRKDFSPSALAQAYEAGGAACLSVLTDTPYFQGTNEHLMEARSATTLPVLRKDFMIDVWQVAEARSIGADCILIILAALADDKAIELHDAALDYGMDVLIEVHDRIELDRALMIPSGMIGINNRNLKTLDVDISTTEQLIKLIPPDRFVVSESGITSAQEIARIQKSGVHSFLIGESLLRQEDVTAATMKLRFE